MARDMSNFVMKFDNEHDGAYPTNNQTNFFCGDLLKVGYAEKFTLWVLNILLIYDSRVYSIKIKQKGILKLKFKW